MRRLYNHLFAFAAIAATLISCSKEVEAPVKEDTTPAKEGSFIMTVNTSNAGTKTVISDPGDGNYNINWGNGDILGVYEVANGTVQNKQESDPVQGGETQTFTFHLPTPTPTGPYKYAFVYPASALGTTEISNQNEYTVNIKQEQTFLANSFDPAADALISEFIESETRPSTVETKFARIGATARMVLKCPTTTETITSITFSTEEGNISGYYTLDPTTGELSDGIVSGQKSVILTPPANTTFTGDIVVWFRLAAITLEGGFAVTVVTNEHTYTKVVDLDAANRTLEFADSKLTKFNVNMKPKTVSFVFSEMGYGNQEEVEPQTKGAITLTPASGTNSNAPKYFTNDSAARFYGGNTFTISSGYSITGITLTFGSSDGNNAITTDKETYSNGSWIGNEKSVTFTIGGSSGNRKIASISVTYNDFDIDIVPDNRKVSVITASDIEMFVGQTKDVVYEIDPIGGEVSLALGDGAEGYVTIDAENIKVTGAAATSDAVPINLSYAGNEEYKPATKRVDVTVYALPVISAFTQTKTGFTATVNTQMEGFSYSWVLYKDSIEDGNIVSDGSRTFTTSEFTGSLENDLTINAFEQDHYYYLVVTASKESLSGSSEGASFKAKDLDNVPTYQKVTSLADVTAGEYIIVNDDCYLPNASTSSAPSAPAVTIVDNKVQDATSDMTWTFSGTTSSMTIKSTETGTPYLYAISNNNGIRVGNTSDTWTIAVNGNGFSLKDATNNRYCATTNNNGGDWRSYNTATSSYYRDDGVVYLYKKVDTTPRIITITAPTHGTVTTSPSPSENIIAGQTITITATPESGYEVNTVSVVYGSTNVETTPGTEANTYTFTMPSNDVTVTVTFVKWVLDGISVTTDPKVDYYVGDHFDPTGMVVTATYKDDDNPSNENQVEIPIDQLSFSPGLDVELAEANTSVKITFGEIEISLAITVTPAPSGPSNQSANYTSNITLSTSGGTSASVCKVKISGTDYDGIKAGTGSAAGAVKITVPSGTKYLHLHLAGWNGESVTLSVAPTGYSNNISLTANSGISGNTPFTFSGDPSTTDYYKVITFTNPLTSDTELTFSATSGKRFVIWGVTAESLSTGNPAPSNLAPVYDKSWGTLQ